MWWTRTFVRNLKPSSVGQSKAYHQKQIQCNLISNVRISFRSFSEFPSAGPHFYKKPYLGLQNLKPAKKKQERTRRRGDAAGGGTYGRGQGGQKSRSGNDGLKGKGFEGGQFPTYRKIPKSRYKEPNRKMLPQPINIKKILEFYDQGRLGNQPLTYNVATGEWLKRLDIKMLYDCQLISRLFGGVELIADSPDDLVNAGVKFDIEVSRASETAIEAVEKAGGRIMTTYFTHRALRALVFPHKYPIFPRTSRPSYTYKKYYVEYKNRGYLSLEKQMEMVLERLYWKEKLEKEGKTKEQLITLIKDKLKP